MSDQVNTTAQSKFQNNLEMMLQQRKSLIYSVAAGPVDAAGAEKVDLKDFLGAVKVQKGNDRHGDTKYTNTPHERVWITKPVESYVADLVDRNDKLATNINIGSGYMIAQRDAINRHWDDQCLFGLYGNMITGKDGTTLTPLAGGMTVPVTTGGAAGAQRMNLDKLRTARKILAQNFNDMQQKRFIVLTAEQQDDLLKDVQLTSEDFKSLGARIDEQTGNFTRILGWNIIEMELSNPMLDASSLTVDGSGYRRNPFWVEDGLAKVEWEQLFAVGGDKLPTKRYSEQYFASTTVATTRTQSGKVGIILNSEA